MKFSKILQPEVALGLRDWPGLFRAEHYKKVLPQMKFVPGHGFSFPNHIADLYETSPLYNSARFEDLMISYKFQTEKAKIYHSPKNFLQALMKVDREIPIDLLPKKFFAYFSFAENSVFDGEHWVQGMYVYIGPPEETSLNPEKYAQSSPRAFWAVYYTQPSSKYNLIEVARLLIDLENEKFKTMADKYPTDLYSVESNPDVFRLGINLALYVNSIGCDLVEAPPVRKMKPSEKKDRTMRGEVMNQCSLPITLVSWNYQHPRTYHVDSTWVDTFMRWQRCGPQNSQVKLIWVTPHPRHFKKE